MSTTIGLWGRKNSSNVQKVLWCCAELDVTVERIDAGREFGKNREDWFLDMNPNGLVPVIEADGRFLWESNAIVRYLARRDPAVRLLATDHGEQAVAEQWMDWQLSALGPAFTPMFHGLVREAPEHRDQNAIERSRAATEHLLGMLDRHLSDRDFIAGGRFGIADIPLGIYAYRWWTFDGILRRQLPSLDRWYRRLQERPAFVEHVMVGLA